MSSGDCALKVGVSLEERVASEMGCVVGKLCFRNATKEWLSKVKECMRYDKNALSHFEKHTPFVLKTHSLTICIAHPFQKYTILWSMGQLYEVNHGVRKLHWSSVYMFAM